MNDLSRADIIAIFLFVLGIITAIANWRVVTSRKERIAAFSLLTILAVAFILWLVWSLKKDDIAGLLPPSEPLHPSPVMSPTPSPIFSPTPASSPPPLTTPTPVREPTPVPTPRPRPTITPMPVVQPRPVPQETPDTTRPGMVTLSFTLLDHSEPVTGARITFTAGGFSTMAYTRNGRATATVPCGVPGMGINVEYQGMRNSAPIRRGLKCQRCHYEAGPIDIGITGVQCLVVSCGGNRTGCY